MGQPEKVEGLHFRRIADRLPRSIPQADVRSLIEGITDQRYRTATLTAYGAGLRISEVVSLQVSDIKSAEGLSRIRAGKGGNECMAYLANPVIEALRRYWRAVRPRPASWLFQRTNPDRPITADSLRPPSTEAATESGSIATSPFTAGTAATHLRERGAPIGVVQDMLGHKFAAATRVYARSTGSMFRTLDHLVPDFVSAT